MTTPEAAREYLAEHQRQMEGRGFAVYNPHNKPVEELPVIYGFNNGGSPGWFMANAISEDGVVLGGHACSSEGYMPHDLGILDGTRPDRHENQYRKHYPDGYRMDFVTYEDVKSHVALQHAFKLNRDRAAEK